MAKNTLDVQSTKGVANKKGNPMPLLCSFEKRKPVTKKESS